jgi:hypothetical protein
MSKRRRELAACRLVQTAYRIYTLRIGDAPGACEKRVTLRSLVISK